MTAHQKAVQAIGATAYGRLYGVVLGRFDVSTDDDFALRCAKDIAARIAEMIEREVGWIESGIHPTLKAKRKKAACA